VRALELDVDLGMAKSPNESAIPKSSRTIPASATSPLGAGAQTLIVSMARIWLGSGESARAFRGIIWDDISELESDMPSHAVQSPPAQMWRSGSMPSAQRITRCCVLIGIRFS
jgi:hypothetical protein